MKKYSLLVTIAFLLIGLVLIPIKQVKAIKAYQPYLINKVIYIDPGHGGKDNGASENGIIEDETNLQISRYLYDYLFSAGVQIYLTRNGDYDLANINSLNRKKDDLDKRVNLINKSQADLFISIHLDSYPSNDVNGARVFYYHDEAIANLIQERLNKLYKDNNECRRDDYYILKNTLITGVLVECGFITGNQDSQLLKTDKHLKEIARQIYLGIVEYFITK